MHPVLSTPNDEASLEAAFRRYLDVYLRQRDPAALRNLLAPDACGFGTGWDESTFGRYTAFDLYQRDLASVPTPIPFEIHDQAVRLLSDDVGVVLVVMDIMPTIAQQKVCLRQLRMSLVWKRMEGEWRLTCLHVSLPTTAHGSDESYPIKELEERAAVLQRLVEEHTAELKRSLKTNERLARHDDLTGLVNRRALHEGLQAELERHARYGEVFSLLLLDVDFFKHINDQYGHLVGDRFLCGLARLIDQRLRKSDLFGRWGGEEFLVVCPATTLAAAKALAETLRSAVAGHDFGLPGVHTTISIGITEVCTGDALESIVQRADDALYQAKATGRNRVVAR